MFEESLKTTEIKPRSAYWDNLKGVLMILVVFAHYLFGLQNHQINDILVDSIYFFHMPAFIFISGYFSKSEHSRSFRPLLTLFVAYVIYNCAFILFELNNGGNLSLTSPYYSAWYLLALMVWRLITPIVENVRCILPLSFVIAVLAGFWPEINLQYAAVKIVNFYPYFLAGYFFKAQTADKIKSLSLKPKLITGFALLITASVAGYLAHENFNLTDHDLLPNSYIGGDFTEMFGRIAIFIVAFTVTAGLLFLSPDRQIPMLTQIGRNSLSVYLLHRPLTLLFTKHFTLRPADEQLFFATLFTFATVIILGSNAVGGGVVRCLNSCIEAMINDNMKPRLKRLIYRVMLLSLTLDVLMLPAVGKFYQMRSSQPTIHRVMSAEMKSKFDGAFKLLFCGDLILLEDQVKNAYNGRSYNFNPMFEYTAKYISGADFAVGVFEGPLGGLEGAVKTYSNSNFDDGKELYLNFPDEFVDAVKAAGFDLVTTANNHLLDVGLGGAKRTIQVLNNKQLDHIGSYSDAAQKEMQRIKIVERDGLKMAFLSYTYGINNYNTEELLNGADSYITSFLVAPNSPAFDEVARQVKRDFEQAKEQSPDLIIVLPHWGTQFSDSPDDFQLTWQKIFLENGADIILGCHTHSVQPVMLNEFNGKTTFTLYCPGNYANIYREHDGDASALVEVYIDKGSKEILGGAIIPMWTESQIRSNYRALPVYDILNDEQLGRELSTYDLKRVEEVQRHITKTMLGVELDLNLVQPRYYFDEGGFMRVITTPLEITGSMQTGKVYQLLQGANEVCFVGDSVTEGTKNGGVGWYEPLTHLIHGQIYNYSFGGATTKTLMQACLNDIAGTEADLFIIAIGTNDIRYRDESICAMTAEDYVKGLERLRSAIIEHNPQAKFVFIAPWTSTDGDTISVLDHKAKLAMIDEYTAALNAWCSSHNDIFVDANGYINYHLNHYPQSRYLTDFIHPNATEGVKLYSTAVLEYR